MTQATSDSHNAPKDEAKDSAKESQRTAASKKTPAPFETIHLLQNEAQDDHRDEAIRQLQRTVARHLKIATSEVVNGETVVTRPNS